MTKKRKVKLPNGKTVEIVYPRSRPTYADISKEGKLLVKLHKNNMWWMQNVAEKYMFVLGRKKVTLESLPGTIIIEDYTGESLIKLLAGKEQGTYQLDYYGTGQKKAMFSLVMDVTTDPITNVLAEVYTNNKLDIECLKGQRYDQDVVTFVLYVIKYLEIVKPADGETVCTVYPFTIFGKSLT